MSEDTVPTIAEIERTMERVWERLEAAVSRLANRLDTPVAGDAWSPRQVLSHVIGAWQRVPMHAAFILAGESVPIQIGDSCWTPEYEAASIEVFQACLLAGYDANVAFLKRLKPEDLGATAETPFGMVMLGDFLTLSYGHHIGDFHTPQLEAFGQ